MPREVLPEPLKILIAPLDWGLGHASRCIPLIRLLLNEKYIVILGGSGLSLTLLRNEFPELPYFEIPGKTVRYGRGSFQLIRFLVNIPGFFFSIWLEHRWIQKYLKNEHIDVIISDNRYGIYHPDCFNAFITHQIKPVISKRIKILNQLAKFLIFKFLGNFDEIWIPDWKEGIKLSGELSKIETAEYPPTYYIGVLSRFSQVSLSTPTVYSDFLVILSGPEPQRTIFESEIIQIAERTSGKWVIVCGRPGLERAKIIAQDRIRMIPHLDTQSMGSLLIHTPVVIARSGYSTLMDLVTLRRTAILVPTPGQKEQEFLGEWMMNNRWFFCVDQSKLHNFLHAKEDGHLDVSFCERDEIGWVIDKDTFLFSNGIKYSVPLIPGQEDLKEFVRNLAGKHKEKVVH